MGINLVDRIEIQYENGLEAQKISLCVNDLGEAFLECKSFERKQELLRYYDEFNSKLHSLPKPKGVVNWLAYQTGFYFG